MEAEQARRSGDWGGGQGAGNGASARSPVRRPDEGWEQNGSTDGREERIAHALGWFSLGLGLAQIAAPGGVARMIGIRDDDENRAVLRTVGLREIASGVGILTRPRPTGWLWSRVAGDMMDLALLGKALQSETDQRDRVAATTAAVVGITVVDLLTSGQLSRDSAREAAGTGAGGGLQFAKSLTINRPVEELYQFWRDFQNLPRFMSRLESVEVTAENRSHWRVKGPAGPSFELDVEIADDRPNERIAWQSAEGSAIGITGVVRFQQASGGRGTEVMNEVRLRPPGGGAGAKLIQFFSGVLEQQVLEDLRRFKQIMETGEVVVSDASIQRERPAQPPPEALVSRWRDRGAGPTGSLGLSPASGRGNR